MCAENGIDRCDDTQNEKGVAHRKSGVVHSLADSVEAFQLGEEPEDADDPKDTKELCIAESSIPGIHDFEKEGHELIPTTKLSNLIDVVTRVSDSLLYAHGEYLPVICIETI